LCNQPQAAEFTTSDVGNAPMLSELFDQIPPERGIGSIIADGAINTRDCHDAVAARGAAAIIPPRKNAEPRKPDNPGAIVRNETRMDCAKNPRQRLCARFRSSGRRVPHPRGRPEGLHRTRHPRPRSRETSPPGGIGASPTTRFEQ
jgi:hypothetical protein